VQKQEGNPKRPGRTGNTVGLKHLVDSVFGNTTVGIIAIDVACSCVSYTREETATRQSSSANTCYDGIGQPQRADMFTAVVVDVFDFNFYGWKVGGIVKSILFAIVPIVVIVVVVVAAAIFVVAICIVVVWGLHTNHTFFVFCDSAVARLYGNFHLHLGIPEFVDMNGLPPNGHIGGGPAQGKMIVEAHQLIGNYG